MSLGESQEIAPAARHIFQVRAGFRFGVSSLGFGGLDLGFDLLPCP